MEMKATCRGTPPIRVHISMGCAGPLASSASLASPMTQGPALLCLFFEGDLQVPPPPVSCLYFLFSLSLSQDPHVPAATGGHHGSVKKDLVQVSFFTFLLFFLFPSLIYIFRH
jgi:hypothetical protein